MTMLERSENPLVLVVEDDKSLRELYDEALTSEGFEVRTASDGFEGLKRFEEIAPDVVLLDLMMPKMDGWEALERLRRVSECPVIIATGRDTTEDIIRGLLEAGADEYLVKPFGIPELVARIRAVLRRSAVVR
ncbi:MAG: response regulator transcription factor [Chloroflexi bacterium]|nr:response regulator transcription factor [Chloroflexota bacterium]